MHGQLINIFQTLQKIESLALGTWDNHTNSLRRQCNNCRTVMMRWTQDNSVARRAGTGPSRITPREDQRIHQLALMNRQMTTAEIWADNTPQTTETPSGILWCSAMSLTSVYGSPIDGQCVPRQPGWRLSRCIPLELLEFMMWGAIGHDNRMDVVCVEGRLNALQQECGKNGKPFVRSFMTKVPNGIFQQDNARSCTAGRTRKALRNVRIRDWPVWSPDLSPIEHVWDVIPASSQQSSWNDIACVSGMARNSSRWHLETVCFHTTMNIRVYLCPWESHLILMIMDISSEETKFYHLIPIMWWTPLQSFINIREVLYGVALSISASVSVLESSQ